MGAALGPLLVAALTAVEPAPTQPVPEAEPPPKLELNFEAELARKGERPPAQVKLEGGAMQVGVDLEGPNSTHARVELAVSTRVAALSLRF